MNTDTQVILNALQKERDELHDKIMQVDRIIKRVKSLEYSSDNDTQPVKELQDNNQQSAINLFPKTGNIKVQILRVFDILNKASTLKQIQTEYSAISGNKYNIREIIRTLNKAGLVKIMRDKTSQRGFMWVKTDWLDNGQLIDKYKPDGFDMLHKAENLTYE